MTMWAQLITVRIKPGREGDLARLVGLLQSAEQPDSGWLRTTAAIDATSGQAHLLVLFENEEKARERESDPRRDEALGAVRELMAEMLDGPPQFADLDVVVDTALS
jgi:hypothetical protein